jgi:hypothetical protein
LESVHGVAHFGTGSCLIRTFDLESGYLKRRCQPTRILHTDSESDTMQLAQRYTCSQTDLTENAIIIGSFKGYQTAGKQIDL